MYVRTYVLVLVLCTVYNLGHIKYKTIYILYIPVALPVYSIYIHIIYIYILIYNILYGIIYTLLCTSVAATVVYS